MRRLLVTGGAGFIGCNFVRYWRERHPQDHVVVLDSLTYAGNLENLRGVIGEPSCHFVRGDIGDVEAVSQLLREAQLDTIVHFAAESHVDRSISGPDAFIATNVVGTHALLKAARRVWMEEQHVPQHRFHHVSTDEVYGSLSATDPAFSETTPYAPNSPYSASKAGSDHLVRAYHQTFGLQVTTSNCSNNYGPHQFPEKLIPLMIVNILQGKPLPVYGDGLNVRDWLHVHDHCHGIELVLQRGRVGEVYNIGGGAEVANIELVQRVCALLDRAAAEGRVPAASFPQAPSASGARAETLIRFVTDRPGHDRRYAIDCRKIESELGYRVANALEAGLRSTVDWYLANEPWWRSVLDGRYRAGSLATTTSR